MGSSSNKKLYKCNQLSTSLQQLFVWSRHHNSCSCLWQECSEGGGGLETDRPQTTYHCNNRCCSCGLYLPFHLFCPLFLMGNKDKAVCGSFVWMWFGVGSGFPTLKETVSTSSSERCLLFHTRDFIFLGWFAGRPGKNWPELPKLKGDIG